MAARTFWRVEYPILATATTEVNTNANDSYLMQIKPWPVAPSRPAPRPPKAPAARVAIGMTPFLLPLMFQIGYGASAFEAGIMLLVYMAGNLAMKSITTPLLHRFGFRDVIRVNGLLCVASLVACGMLSPAVSLPVVYGVLLVAGMTRSMNFTAMSTLAFADVSGPLRAGATTLSAMAQQAASALGVAAAAVALGGFQALRAGTELAPGDFRNAFFVAAAVMALAMLWSLRLPADAGAELSRRA